MRHRIHEAVETFTELAAARPWWSSLLAAALAFPAFHLLHVALAAPGALPESPLLHAVALLAAILEVALPLALLAAGACSLRGGCGRRTPDRRDSVVVPLVSRLDARRLEGLVIDGFLRRGYRVRQCADGARRGVDLELRRGGELAFVRCSAQRSGRVGVAEVRALAGVMAVSGASRAYVVTSGRFTREASRLAAACNIRLIDGALLAGWLSTGRERQITARDVRDATARPAAVPVAQARLAAPRDRGRAITSATVPSSERAGRGVVVPLRAGRAPTGRPRRTGPPVAGQARPAFRCLRHPRCPNGVLPEANRPGGEARREIEANGRRHEPGAPGRH